MTSIRDRASTSLTAAMKRRDKSTVAVCRRLLAAFSNAEAVPSTARAGAFEASSSVGSSDVEVPRRTLDEDELVAIAQRELAELMDEGVTAREQAAVARRLIDGATIT